MPDTFKNLNYRIYWRGRYVKQLHACTYVSILRLKHRQRQAPGQGKVKACPSFVIACLTVGSGNPQHGPQPMLRPGPILTLGNQMKQIQMQDAWQFHTSDTAVAIDTAEFN